MPACHVTNASTGLISFRKYPQLRLVRPTPSAFVPDMISMRAMKTSLFWVLMSALMQVECQNIA